MSTADSRPLVLIIDADESTTDLYGDWFTSIGFQVMCAVGVNGLSFALRRERPRQIISELHARDLTLSALFTRLRSDETTRCIPVIVLTGSCDDSVLRDARRLGVVTVLPKFCASKIA